MYPVTITVHNDEQLKAVHAALQGVTSETSATPTPTPTKAKKAATAPAAAAAPATEPAKTEPAKPALSAAGQAFILNQLSEPVLKLSMKDEPAMKAICAEYGVERVSLIPEKLFPEVLEKVLNALDPGAAERKRLEAVDKGRSLI